MDTQGDAFFIAFPTAPGALAAAAAARDALAKGPIHARMGLHSDVELRDLGPHRLKDLSAPARIYQLGNGDFPPLETRRAVRVPQAGTATLRRSRW